MGASYIGGCIFRFGDQCSILNTKKCKGCKFKKTADEWDEGQKKVEEILNAKGLEACGGADLNGDRIITTRPITELPTGRYICDHEKNTQCKKTSCGYLDRGECFHTTNKDFKKEEN